MGKEIDWSKASIEDYTLAKQITERFANEVFDTINKQSLQMDVIAVHVGGCKLKLQELLESATADFLHDIWGIMKHIDRESGQLQDCFWPRYSC